MPLFRVEIFKAYQGETWENRYHIEAEGFEAVSTPTAAIVQVERLLHGQEVIIEYARVSTIVEGDNLFVTFPYDVPGLGSLTSLLPLFNVARVNLAKNLRRPDFKLYRGVLAENVVEDGVIDVSYREYIEDQIATIVGTTTPVIVSQDGSRYTSAECETRVAQRALRRRKRRNPVPSTPV